MNFKKLWLYLFIAFSATTFAQQKISGSVKDSTGKPLPEASVIVVGTQRNAKTNAEGAYTISAKENEVLHFSASGYKSTEVKVGVSTTIDVVLPQAEAAAEEGALGIKRDKNAVGYTAQKAGASDNLSGSVAGVQTNTTSSMGGNTNVTIRGVGTITGSNQPLIVIDGVPMATVGGTDSKFGDAAGDINPEDIESVTVLSGGAATALYGSRGGNGVILYTTKSGKAGKTSIDVKSGVTFEKIYIAPKLQNEYGGGDSQRFETVNINGRQYKIARYAVDQSWGPKFENQQYLPWYAFDKEYLPEKYLKTVPWKAPDNDVDKFYTTGVGISNSISVSRSLSGTNLRFSLGNNEVTGIVPTTKLQKTNFSFNFNSKLSSKLKSEGGVNYVLTERDNPDFSNTVNNPLAIVHYTWSQRQLDMRNLERYYENEAGDQRPWNRTAWNNAEPKFVDNPYWELNKNTNNDKRHRFFGNIGFTYEFSSQLYWVGKIYGDIYSLTKEDRKAVGSFGTPYYTKTVYNNPLCILNNRGF